MQSLFVVPLQPDASLVHFLSVLVLRYMEELERYLEVAGEHRAKVGGFGRENHFVTIKFTMAENNGHVGERSVVRKPGMVSDMI